MLPTPKKSYGQHFLHDQRVLQKITDMVLGKVGDTLNVVEVGPGRGALTGLILPALEKRLCCVEFDPRMVTYLKETYPRFTDGIIEADFLQWQPPSDMLEKGLAVVGNFPYNISTQIVFRVLHYRTHIPVVIGMFQKEVGKRIASAHGTKDYGILSVLAQSYYDVKYEFDIAPGSFNPPPKVMSGVISMTYKTIQPDVDYALLERVVKAAFNQRRKMLRNALLAGGFSVDGIDDSILNKRAEQLSVTDFQALAKIIKSS